MNIMDMFSNGHRTMMCAVEGVSEYEANLPDVCGTWSIRDIMINIRHFKAVFFDQF